MTDPVRPVAPREDIAFIERVIERAKRECLFSEKADYFVGTLRRVWTEELAAAPVPCALSHPADELEDVLRTISEIAMLAASDPHAAADFYRAKLVKICNIALQARDVRAPAPTGEEARDAELRNGEEVSRSVERVDRSAHATAGTVTGADRRGDLTTDDSHSGSDDPVAVSLDPHRLREIDAALSELRDYIKDRKRVKYQPHQCVVRAMQHLELARLRGAAAVRVEE